MKNKNIAVYNEEQENALIKRDFVFVVVLNILLFALMIAVYFWNRSTGQVTDWFNSFMNFI